MTTMEAPMGGSGSMSQGYGPLPASPTLTNPDMILPDYDRTPSPDDDRSHSPLMMWKNARATAAGLDLAHLYTTTPGGGPQPHAFPAGPITPTTPIIYGNGTMLSDIGEVTEAESTPGKPSPSRRRVAPGPPVPGHLGNPEQETTPLSDRALRSSPTMGATPSMGVKERAKHQASQERLRRSSMDSTSTITTQENAVLFADFDDTMSVGDSVFQGDDEESVAESYSEDISVREAHVTSRATVGPNGATNGDGVSGGTDTENSQSITDATRTAALSRRAEEILANAKKRLTTMEGNLSRARSLHVASSSISSFDSSTPSPPIQLRSAAILQEARGSSPTLGGPGGPGHARMGSDNILRIGIPVKVDPQRSQSAMGAAGGYREPSTSSRSVEQIRESLHGGAYKSPHSREASLEPLSEDDLTQDLPSADKPSNQRTSAQLDSFLSPTFGTPRELKRPASAAQMRDIKDHMKDLKGKISTLREQARADSMKRRSLQSLRTPSPFTHARPDPWQADMKPDHNAEQEGKVRTEKSPWNGEESVIDGQTAHEAKPEIDADQESVVSAYENAEGVITPLSQPHRMSPVKQDREASEPGVETGEAIEDDMDDMHTENGDVEDDPDYMSDSGESAYHDTLQHPLSHEDREDAFDYEHFILHSALGTIAQQRMARRGSFSSEDSVETTRGPIVENRFSQTSESRTGKRSATPSRTHNRRGSAGSTTSTDSFATATEGRQSRTNRTSSGSDEDVVIEEEFSSQIVTIPEASPTTSPLTAKKITFRSITDTTTAPVTKRNSAEEPRSPRHQPVTVRRPASSAATMAHRPSVSSFESTGTVRSFPLINRKKSHTVGAGGPGPDYGPTVSSNSPYAADEELKNISETLLNETASMCEGRGSALKYSASVSSIRSTSSAANGGGANAAAMRMLSPDDQLLVERLVAALGKCVLGLTESGKASTDGRMYRKRIDAARRLLEGLEGVDS